MRRIGRWVINALTVLSLLLCVGTCVLWVRSYQRNGAMIGIRIDGFDCAFIHRGRVGLSGGVLRDDGVHIRVIGFSLYTRPTTTTAPRLIAVPLWFPTILSLIVPVWRAVPRRNGNDPGHDDGCHHCSYDLTGNVSGVCPECGEKIAEAK
jgi:hypothetical protein